MSKSTTLPVYRKFLQILQLPFQQKHLPPMYAYERVIEQEEGDFNPKDMPNLISAAFMTRFLELLHSPSTLPIIEQAFFGSVKGESKRYQHFFTQIPRADWWSVVEKKGRRVSFVYNTVARDKDLVRNICNFAQDVVPEIKDSLNKEEFDALAEAFHTNVVVYPDYNSEPKHFKPTLLGFTDPIVMLLANEHVRLLYTKSQAKLFGKGEHALEFEKAVPKKKLKNKERRILGLKQEVENAKNELASVKTASVAEIAERDARIKALEQELQSKTHKIDPSLLEETKLIIPILGQIIKGFAQLTGGLYSALKGNLGPFKDALKLYPKLFEAAANLETLPLNPIWEQVKAGIASINMIHWENQSLSLSKVANLLILEERKEPEEFKIYECSCNNTLTLDSCKACPAHYCINCFMRQDQLNKPIAKLSRRWIVMSLSANVEQLQPKSAQKQRNHRFSMCT
eukprot:TRINITY_DN3445_c0_g1_i1.p1 TRINITY_DN3445_c0_g1~~TRINITY_DN3445_c0_g1_i1.p1  ORF type:complete len:456 (-),score=23.35 TRINITY_DN3445_c0_g1_i1:325-1692(-)